SLSPSSGPIEGGSVITITGSGFVAGATVTVGGVAATDVTVTPTSITATVPAHAAGDAEVRVSIPGFNDAIAPVAFTYAAPTLAATGMDAAPIGIAGLVLLGFGAALTLARRRRAA
ncbi:MAG: hypothetical protein JWO10_1691, partial [Microbacteriaceae bacterium]|nr:hypothetical protein [Microbacteriaceae bacterium]